MLGIGSERAWSVEPASQQSPASQTETQALFSKGTALLQKGDWNEAVTVFDAILSQDPSSSGAHFNKGCALALQGQQEKALEEFSQALKFEAPPTAAFCYFNIAGVYTKQAIAKKDSALLTQAADNFKKASQAMPNFVLAVDYAYQAALLASALTQEGVAERINMKFSVSAQGTPPDSARFLAAAQDAETQNYVFDRNDPPLLFFYQSPSMRFLICTSDTDTHHFILSEQDQRCLQKLVEQIDNEPRNRLDQWVKTSVYAAWFLHFRTTGDDIKVHEYGDKIKALILEEKERLAGSSPVLAATPNQQNEMTIILPSQQDTVESLIQQGRRLGLQGKREEAMTQFKHALALDPQNANAHYYLGIVYFSLNNDELALQEFQAVLQQTPNSVNALDNIAGIRVRQKQFEAAKELFERSKQLEPAKDPFSHYNLAVLYTYEGQTTKAQEEYQFLQTYFPKYATALAPFLKQGKHINIEVHLYDNIEVHSTDELETNQTKKQ